MSAPLSSIAGTIAVLQESRFQLMDETGAAHMFMLSPKAAIEPKGLKPLHASAARVVVDYRDVAGLIARVAERVALAAEGPA